MYTNILAELARRQMSKVELAGKLNMSVFTFDRKIRNESGFTVNEIKKMQTIFNDANCTFEYLFQE